jgi:hypothetical protein
MEFIKRSQRTKPKVSLILLDWSVRESFHLLDYLAKQTLPREQFEVVIVEYYSRVSAAIKKFEEQVDTWLKLDMPTECYYHKHLMYNVGVAVAKGELIVICDSDAMAKPSFLQTIVTEFENNPDQILHIDQFRNNRRDLYPFCYPSFEEVLGEGCINNVNGKTKGVMPTDDPIHERNYGACFCAKRSDIIAIGGADEHIDFVGHICGPYDLTFRLLNLDAGKEIHWHEGEFLYHTWHPGQAGEDNYLGPHDGKHMSTTSLEALASTRIQPHVINPAIAYLQQHKGVELNESELMKLAVSADNRKITKRDFLEGSQAKAWAIETHQYNRYMGFLITKQGGGYVATPLSDVEENNARVIKAESFEALTLKLKKKGAMGRLRWFFAYLLCFLQSLRAVILRKTSIKSSRDGSSEIIANSVKKEKKMEGWFCSKVKSFFYFSKKVLAKLKSLSVEAAYRANLLQAVILNLKAITQSEQKAFMLASRASLSRWLLRIFFHASQRNHIILQQVGSSEELTAFLDKVNGEALTGIKIVTTNQCYLQYSSVFINCNRFRLIII